MSLFNIYKKVNPDDLILRDYLAIERTILSNESTFLAYIRTALTLIGAGATVIHFAENDFLLNFFGWFFVLSGVAIAFWGGIRYKNISDRISLLDNKKEEYEEKMDKELVS